MELKWHFNFKLLLPVIIGIIVIICFAIPFTAIKSKNQAEIMGNQVKTITFDQIRNKKNAKREQVKTLFTKLENDFYVLSNYSSNLFNGNFSIKNYYQNYYAVISLDASQPSLDSYGKNYENSVWYKHGLTTLINYQNNILNISTTLNNAFRTYYYSEQDYTDIYFGFNDGTFRKYPYERLNNYPTFTYTCITTGLTTVGYDPRCRGWYDNATKNKDKVIFSQPYVDASTGNNIITVSKAIYNDSGIIGVLGGDLSIRNLYNSIAKDKIMNNGFIFLIDANGNIVIYPDSNVAGSTPYFMNELFSNENEKQKFSSYVNNLLNEQEGKIEYTRNEKVWTLVFEKVDKTPYIICITLPNSDMEVAENKLINDVDVSVGAAVGISVPVLIVVLVICIFINYYVTQSIAEPINYLVSTMDKVTNTNLDVEMENIPPPSVEMELLFNQFGDLLNTMRSANEQYRQGNPRKALDVYKSVMEIMERINNKRGIGVCLNNMGNAYSDIDELIHARTCYEKAIKNVEDCIRESSEPTEVETLEVVLGKRHMNLGVYLKNKEKKFEDARNHFDTSIDYYKRHQYEVGIAKVHGNIGQLFLSQNLIHQAEEYFEDNLNIVKDSNNEIAIQYSYMNMGILKFTQNKFSEAAKWFVPVLTNYQNPVEHVKIVCLTYLVEIYKKFGRLDLIQNITNLYEVKGIRKSKDITFVLDKSGSMAGSPIRTCINSINMILDNYIFDNDNISLVTFNDRITNDCHKTIKSSSNIKNILATIATDRQTAFYDALLYAINNTDINNSLSYIIALTDGEDNKSNQNSYKTILDIVSRSTGLTIIIITLGQIQTEGDIKKICNSLPHTKKGTPRGKHIFANNVQSLESAFKEAAEFMNTASEVEVETF
jgi:tetratricopeptide (TPR) repeat protein